jgi:ribosomal protein S18 acetylase RimI-like enzyme
MEIKLKLAKKKHLQDCLNCIKKSTLWDTYFEPNPMAKNNILMSIKQKQTFIALNKRKKCIGILGAIHNGCFSNFSYLSILAVKKKYRSRGIGKHLIGEFEKVGFEKANRVFLLVGEYNKRAQNFYRNLKYKKVGNIPSLFKDGVSEQLWIKYQD